MADRANSRGQRLERDVADLLTDSGYVKVKSDKFFAFRHYQNQAIFAHQFPIGKCIFGKNRRVDFILYHPNRWSDNLVIQCKWQASSGSVEEKFPYEVLSIQQGDFKTIIVLDGGGYSTHAAQWIKSQAGKTKLIHVMDFGELCKFQSQGRL